MGQKQPLRSTRSQIYSDWWVVWRAGQNRTANSYMIEITR
jgi:hypothetical protein